jgi:hypothetical protein
VQGLTGDKLLGFCAGRVRRSWRSGSFRGVVGACGGPTVGADRGWWDADEVLASSTTGDQEEAAEETLFVSYQLHFYTTSHGLPSAS